MWYWAASRALASALGTLSLGVLASVVLAIALGRHLSKLYRREQLAMKQAERATAAREELLAIVAHDLRNPLSAIGLRANSLLGHLGGDKASKHAEAIARMVDGTERLLKSLLDAARIEAGRFSLERAPVGAEELLQECVEMFGTLAASQAVRLERSAGRSDLTLLVDRERMMQVLSNLLGNAIKFTPPGGSIEISVTREPDEQVHFRVSDTGPESCPTICRASSIASGRAATAAPRARAWACTSPGASSRPMAAASGPKASPAGAPPFISPCR